MPTVRTTEREPAPGSINTDHPATATNTSEDAGILGEARGGSATSGMFMLQQPTQMWFNLQGGASAPPGEASAALVLNRLSAHKVQVISQAGLGHRSAQRSTFRCNSTVLLAPGNYTWQLEVRPDANATALQPNITGSAGISPTYGTFTTSGIGSVAMVLSGFPDKNVTLQAKVFPAPNLAPNERLLGRYKIYKFKPNVPVFTPDPLIHHGPFSEPLDGGTFPMIFEQGTEYLVTFEASTDGSTPLPIEIRLEVNP